MKTIQLITKVIGLLIFTSGVNSSFAEQIQVSTTFSCSTNAECKRKCEALGRDHTWKPNPGGSTLGTCTKKIRLSPPSKATLDSRSTVTKNIHLAPGGIYGQECFYRCYDAHIAYGWRKDEAHARCERRCGVSMPAQYELFYGW